MTNEKKRCLITLQYSVVTANPDAAIAEAKREANRLRKSKGDVNARVLSIHASGIGVDSLEPERLVYGTDFETVTKTEAQ